MKIIGTGKAMPSLSVTNEMLAEILDTSDEWISTRTGIRQRRIISDETLVDLASDAARKAIEDAGLTVSDIDFILCSNVVNNYVTPSLSCIIQGEIGATCPTLDINAACTGFLYALDIADAYIKTEKAKNVLIICAEEPSRMVDWKERNTCVLFGDGAAAVVVTQGDSFKEFYLTTHSRIDPLYYQRKLEYNPYVIHPDGDAPLVMNGKDVFKLAVSSSVADITAILKKAGMTPSDIDYYILHQANIRIIDSIRDFLKQPSEKFPHNIENYGNTSSATIPILLDELSKAGKLKKGDKLLLSAFGAGFTTGAVILEWSK